MTELLISLAIVGNIGLLDADEYHVRAKADHFLRCVLPYAVSHLPAAAVRPQSIESQRRCSALLRLHRWQSAERNADELIQQFGAIPWIDMLPEDLPDRSEIMAYYLEEARKDIGNGKSPIWKDYRLATKRYLLDRLRCGYSRSKLLGLLRTMASRENDWIDSNGRNYTPPMQRTFK